MRRWQQHVVVQRVGDRLEGVTHRDEVDHILVLVERPGDFGPHAIVVAVQRLADVAVERDEVRCAEHMALFLQIARNMSATSSRALSRRKGQQTVTQCGEQSRRDQIGRRSRVASMAIAP